MPVNDGAPISVNDHVTFAEPSTDLPVDPIVIVLAVPHVEVVIFAEPLNEVPLIVLAVCKVVAVDALPVNGPVIPANVTESVVRTF